MIQRSLLFSNALQELLQRLCYHEYLYQQPPRSRNRIFPDCHPGKMTTTAPIRAFRFIKMGFR
jgi:hypothetical protein